MIEGRIWLLSLSEHAHLPNGVAIESGDSLKQVVDRVWNEYLV